MTPEHCIRDRLVEHGRMLFDPTHKFLPFTQDDAANRLLNDLACHPHAFALASIMDQQVKAERAWLIPHRIKEKLGSFSMDVFLTQSESDFRHLMTGLHRFVDRMARFFSGAVRRIAAEYKSDASLIWKGRPSSATVVSDGATLPNQIQ